MSRIATIHRIRWYACGLALTVVFAAQIEASILVPVPQYAVDEPCTVPAARGGARLATFQTERESQFPLIEPLRLGDMPLGGVPCPIPSSSSSSGAGNGGPPCTILICFQAVTPTDPEFVGWVTARRRLLLPVPLGNDLLRPPQA
jgi:hypothetical protein